MVELTLPKYDHMETVWLLREDVFEFEPNYILMVYPIKKPSITQLFAQPSKTTLLHRLIAVRLEINFENKILNGGGDDLIEYLSFFCNDKDVETSVLTWQKELHRKFPQNRRLSYDHPDLLVDHIDLTLLTDIYFNALFTDRLFLFKFNALLANLVKILNPIDCPNILTPANKLKRPNYIPKWLQKGIIKRDLGRCVHCAKDLTNVFRLEKTHFDHIIPLHDYGTNDPCNFQLLCQDCNLHKSSNRWIPPQEELRFW